MAEDIVLNLKINKSDLDKNLADVTAQIKVLMSKNEELTKSFKEGKISEEQYNAQTKELKTQLNSLVAQQAENINASNAMTKSTVTLQKELRGMKVALAEMEKSGKAGTREYWEMARAAGGLKDNIGDANQAINYFSSDTRRLDFAVAGIKGVASAASVATGAMNTLGISNESFEESLRKMQGLQTMIMGLKETSGLLKEGTLKIGIMSGAQSLYTTVVGTSTGALKAFKIALASTGIGLLIVGLGVLIANLDKLSGLFGGNATQAKKLADENDNLTKSIQKQNTERSNQRREEELLHIAKSKILANDIKSLEVQADALKKQDQKNKIFYDNLVKYGAKEKDIAKAREEYDKLHEQYLQSEANLGNLILEQNNAAIEEQKKAQEDALKKAEERKKILEEYNKYKKNLVDENRKTGIKSEKELALIEVEIWKAAQLEEINNLKVSEEKKNELRLTLAKTTANKINDINVAEAKNEAVKKAEFIKKYAEDTQKINDSLAEKEAVTRESKLALIENWYQKEIELAGGDKDKLIAITENRKAKEAEINAEFDAKIKEDSIASIKAYNEDIAAINEELKLSKIQNRSDELEYLAEWYNEQLKLHKDNEKEKAALDNDYHAKKSKVNRKWDLKESEDRKAINQAVGKAAIQIASASADAIYTQKQNKLDREKEKELSNKNLTEDQKAAIEKKYAQKQKELDIKKAIVNTALAVGNALQTQPFFPMGLIAAGIAAVTGAIQVATISKTQYKTGGAVIGKSHSLGGVDVNLEGGEAIVNAQSMKNPAIAQQVIGLNNLGNAGLSQNYTSNQLDEDRIASIVAKTISVIPVEVSEHKISKANKNVLVRENRFSVA